MSVPVIFDKASFSYDGNGNGAICSGLDMQIQPETIVGIVGPSGVGKTTLLSLQAGLISTNEGSVRIANQDPVQARKSGLIAYAPQRGALCTWLTALENIELSMKLCRRIGDVKQIALEMLQAFGLGDDVNKHPQELSGGMQQRVILAMALGANRPLVLLDEPFVALDSHTRHVIHEYLLNEWQGLSSRPTIVMVSHDLNEAVYLCDQILVVAERPVTSVAEFVVPLARPRESSMRYEEPFLGTVKVIEDALSRKVRNGFGVS